MRDALMLFVTKLTAIFEEEGKVDGAKEESKSAPHGRTTSYSFDDLGGYESQQLSNFFDIARCGLLSPSPRELRQSANLTLTGAGAGPLPAF